MSSFDSITAIEMEEDIVATSRPDSCPTAARSAQGNTAPGSSNPIHHAGSSGGSSNAASAGNGGSSGKAQAAAGRITAVATRDKRFNLLEGETLLEGLERTGHDVEYQCRSGYCGMCRLTLIQGSVSYESLPLAFVGPSEILPCCCTIEEAVTVDCGLRADLDSQFELFRDDLLDGTHSDQD